jgi:hypothetical protein
MESNLILHLLDQDYGSEAMSTLLRLDKGLRSTVISQQCESVMKCAELIQSNPIPIIINTTLIKLSDLFKNSDSNFTRYWIFKAFLSIQGEIPKLLNKMEVLKRISHVLLSNDPIARGHTCRILGLMASEAMESSEILVKIQSRVMETHHLFELTCSIYALDKICRISKHDVTEKLYLRITQVETPIRIKIQLIRILRHSPTMETVTKLYKLAVMYPSTPILSVILSVLGYVTRQSILVAKSVFEFFTLLLEEEARHLVKKQILLEMYAIVKQSPGSFVKYLEYIDGNCPRSEEEIGWNKPTHNRACENRNRWNI